MAEVNTLKEQTFVSVQEWLQSSLSMRWFVLTLYQVMKEGMRHQLARPVTRHDLRPLVAHFCGLTRTFGCSRRTPITGASQTCVLGGWVEERRGGLCREEALEDDFGRLLRKEPTPDDLKPLLSERPRNTQKLVITVAQPSCEERSEASQLPDGLLHIQALQEWCRSADDSLTRVLVVWNTALNGLTAQEISPWKSNDFL